MVVGIEKKIKGISILYAKVIDNASAKELGGFMKAHIDPKATITTGKWSGYQPLVKDFENLTQIYSGDKGGSFPELHRVIMNLKGWLRGVHHHVRDLQDYLDEYCYRFNRSFMKENIFDNLMNRTIIAKPWLISNISDYTKGAKDGASNAFASYEQDLNPFYATVPLHLKLRAGLGENNLFFYVGPYVSIGVAGKFKANGSLFGGTASEERDIKWGDGNNDDLRRFDYGASIGGGIEISKILLGVEYSYGLANLAPDTDDGNKMQNRMVRFSVGFILGGE